MSVTKMPDIKQPRQGRNYLFRLIGSKSFVYYGGESVAKQVTHGGQKVEQSTKELGEDEAPKDTSPVIYFLPCGPSSCILPPLNNVIKL